MVPCNRCIHKVPCRLYFQTNFSSPCFCFYILGTEPPLYLPITPFYLQKHARVGQCHTLRAFFCLPHSTNQWSMQVIIRILLLHFQFHFSSRSGLSHPQSFSWQDNRYKWG